MVKKGESLFGEGKFKELLSTEGFGSHSGNGRVFYEHLQEEKMHQQNVVNVMDSEAMPCDISDYNTMFMTF